MPVLSAEERTLTRLSNLETRFNDLIGQDKPGSTRFATGGVVFGVSATAPPTVDATNFFWDDSANRLGIGTNAPANPLHVLMTTGNQAQFKSSAADSEAGLLISNDARSYILRILGSNADVFQVYDSTAGSARISIDTNGYTYISPRATIGSTNAPTRPFTVDAGASPSFMSFGAAGVEKWVIGNDTGSSHVFIFYNPTNGYAGFITQANFWRFGDSTAPSYRVELPNLASTSGQGRANAWPTYSSRSLKRNIRPINPKALRQRIKDFKIVEFEWNAEENVGITEIGAIAEDVYAILPELVTGDMAKPDTLGIKESKAGVIALALILDHIADAERELPPNARN